ncbi:Beta-tubulin folding cofactor D [Plasmopara halstedii]|uniref:Beta-tubulin folding cofactor D n=2 Tax=Plasmopara halstedii TaxID=4781 RepID=A0A0P1B8C7_PLAHL|nr:Beta-tubulin folding cofactor D [Plasmopara halstedii]CEG50500.1 Beta-tubulin folding cofactor D [Plasmopara halstedii]|eukprot:XP_024586869.1 Beta-tubulin folding cofactor D [Plasmopara halstedii]
MVNTSCAKNDSRPQVPNNWNASQITSQKGKTVIITGANSGIGYETALELARKGANVVLACRSEERGKEAEKKLREALASTADAGSVNFKKLDVSDLKSVSKFANEFKSSHDRLDLLINNAGVMAVPYAQTVDGNERQFAVNHLAVPESESCSEQHFFEERDQVRELLRKLIQIQFPTQKSDVDREFLTAHATVLTILDKYLEHSHLLDPYLREMLDPLVTEIKRVMAERTIEARKRVVFPCQVYRDPRLHKLFQIVYQLCKVRGYKTVIKLLSHEVSDFEPTLQLLQSQDQTDHSVWETRYVLLLWLSMLCLVPFDLNTIDSSSAGEHTSGTISLVSNIVTLCKNYLSDPGLTQEAAAVCLSRLLSRPDMEQHALTRFLNWANRELQSASEGNDMRLLQFKVTGIMLCLAHIAKNSPREQHIIASRIYFISVMKLIAHLTENCGRSDRPNSSTLHRKLSVKLVQRLGLLYLPPKVRSWRYSRGLRSLELNMLSFSLATGNNVTSTISRSVDLVDDDDDDAFEVVEELEQIVEALLCGLRDRDTVVRWSAAKGIGRITGRLPYKYADDIVQSVLELFVATEDDGAWHGASLALAELARRGVLLPQRLPDAVDCVANALTYDIRKGTYSIGSHVRDAACYACWSFARAYEPSLLLPWLQQVLAPAMLVNCVFDRELNCRRASSAAFQENIGRQGRTNFPNGIDLLTKADYFSIANLRHAYLDVSVFVAKYPDYRYALLEHLVAIKIVHWDAQIRTLAAAALGKIGALDPPHVMMEVFPRIMTLALSPNVEVIVRHGALMSSAELLANLRLLPANIDGEVQKKMKMLPIEIENRRLFRGRGGEMIRSAVCNVIEVISTCRLSLGFAHMKKYLSLLEECFVHPNERVRDAAIDAFSAFTTQYCHKVFQKGTPSHVYHMQGIIPRYINSGIMVTSKENCAVARIPNPCVAARQGYLRAVGVAAKELVQPCVKEVLDVVIQSALIQEHPREDEDPGSRVAAVQALVNLSSRPPDELDFNGMEDEVVSTLVRCIQLDYRLDERGDVGSWVRKAAMLGLEKLLLDVNSPAQNNDGHIIGTRVQTAYGSGVIVDKLFRQKWKTDEINKADSVCYVKFEKPTLGYYYFSPEGVGLIHAKSLIVSSSADPEVSCEYNSVVPNLATRLKFAEDHSATFPVLDMPFIRRMSPHLVSSICTVLAKQLAEKLDTMRMTAGSILFRLLHSTVPRVDGIPGRVQLEKIFPLNLEVNWSMANDTFPLVVQMMDIPEFLEEVTAGLVISVGGLTESVTKASKSALFEWMRKHLLAKHYGVLNRFSFFLLTLLKRHHRDDRIAVPIMKTLALLLESNLLQFLFQKRQDDENDTIASDFGEQLYKELCNAIQKCTLVPKLSAAIYVLIGLLPSDPGTETKSLRALVLFLGHKFPKVRQLTAAKLYTRLLLHENVIDGEKYDTVVEILSNTAWEASIVHVRLIRKKLLLLLGMDLPSKKDSIPASLKTVVPTLEDDTGFKHFIKESGY